MSLLFNFFPVFIQPNLLDCLSVWNTVVNWVLVPAVFIFHWERYIINKQTYFEFQVVVNTVKKPEEKWRWEAFLSGRHWAETWLKCQGKEYCNLREQHVQTLWGRDEKSTQFRGQRICVESGVMGTVGGGEISEEKSWVVIGKL